VSDTQQVIIEELEELGLFKLNTGNNLVQDVVGVALWVTGDDADGLLEDLEGDSNLDQVLNDLQNDDLQAWRAHDQQVEQGLQLIGISNLLDH
jgi:hypothetical protein